MISLSSIQSPDQLRPGQTLTEARQDGFHLTVPSPVAVDLQWMREVATGVLEGTTGIRVDAGVQASISAQVRGSFEYSVRRDDAGAEPWLRLTVRRARQGSVGVAVDASISARAASPLPSQPAELLAALAGRHPRQWLRSALKDIGSAAWKDAAARAGTPLRVFDRISRAWAQLSAQSEPLLLDAAGDPVQLEEIAKWAKWIADERPSAAALAERVAGASAGHPGWVTSPAGAWVEMLMGSPSSEGGMAAAAAAVRDLLSLENAGTHLSSLAALARQSVPEVAQEWAGLVDRVYGRFREALSKSIRLQLTSQLSASAAETSLLDVSFRMDAEGLRLYRRALTGDWSEAVTAASPAAGLHLGTLTHTLGRRQHIEVHIPFCNAREIDQVLTTMSHAEVTTDDAGRLLVVQSMSVSERTTTIPALLSAHQSRLILGASISVRDGEPRNDNFSLTFTDVRDLPADGSRESYKRLLAAYGVANGTLPAGKCRATLSLSVPGTQAAAWLHAPLPREEAFFPVMSRVSVALQTAMRRWLPVLYLACPRRFDSPQSVYPLLVYQYSAPHVPTPRRKQFGYDFMDPNVLAKVVESSQRELAPALSSIFRWLCESGDRRLAQFYATSALGSILHEVFQQRRNIASLIYSDNTFVDNVVYLASYGRDLQAMCPKSPRDAARLFGRYSREFVQVFHRQLGRLYANEDFTALGSLLLVEATAALTERPDAIAASLVIE